MNSDPFNWDNQHMLYFKTVGKDCRTTSLDRLLYKIQTNRGKIPCETIDFLPCSISCWEWIKCNIWAGTAEVLQQGNPFQIFICIISQYSFSPSCSLFLLTTLFNCHFWCSTADSDCFLKTITGLGFREPMRKTKHIKSHRRHPEPLSHISLSKEEISPGKGRKSSNLENLLNPMTCKRQRWRSHMVASVDILFLFSYFCGCLVLLRLLLIWQIFWRHNTFRRLGVIDSFLCDCPPATFYRNAESQDVFNAPLTCSDYLAELTQKKGDSFL